MSIGINGADPFKSYGANPNAGGGITGYRGRRRKSDKKDDEQSLVADTSDEEDYDVDMDDIDLDDEDFSF